LDGRGHRPGSEEKSFGVEQLNGSDRILVNQRLEVGRDKRLFAFPLVDPVKDLEKMFSDPLLHPQEIPSRLQGMEGLLDILLEVLDQGSRLLFEQKVKPLLCSIDFEEAVDGQKDENDS